MAKQIRVKTSYEGVYYVEGHSRVSKKPEKIFYIRYRKNGKSVEEKAGKQYEDNMTAAKASQMRSRRIANDQLSNEEKRQVERKLKEANENRWTIDKLWEEYKSTTTIQGLVSDENRYDNYIKPDFADKEPKEITHFDIKRLEKSVTEKGRTAATTKHVLEILRRICNFGKKKNLCEGLTFTIVMPELDNEKTEDLTPDELKRLLDAIEKDHDIQAKNIMKMALFTGMRRGELFKLKWEDISFERNLIYIKSPKGGKSQKIPLSQVSREILLTHERPYPDSPYVFPGRDGGQRTDIKRPVNRIKKIAGLPDDFRPLHGLRHVYATMLASSGKVDMYTLQKLLTHKSPQMTQRYAHLRDETLKQASEIAIDVVNEAIKKAG